MKDKYFDRIVFMFAFLCLSYKCYTSIIKQGHYIIGSIILTICLFVGIVYLDLSGYLPFTINKRFVNLPNKHFDLLGWSATFYLFYLSVV